MRVSENQKHVWSFHIYVNQLDRKTGVIAKLIVPRQINGIYKSLFKSESNLETYSGNVSFVFRIEDS